MPTIEVVLVDSFTATPFTGNPAAVVVDATALDERAMKAVAAELARPATAFLRPAGAGGERPVRWFSPAGIELTLCGHGTVAAAHVLAARGETPRDGLVFQAPRHRLAHHARAGRAPPTSPGSSRTVRGGSRSRETCRRFSRSSGCRREPWPRGRRPRGRPSRIS